MRVYLKPVGAYVGSPLDAAVMVELRYEGDAIVLYVNGERTIWQAPPKDIALLIAWSEGR